MALLKNDSLSFAKGIGYLIDAVLGPAFLDFIPLPTMIPVTREEYDRGVIEGLVSIFEKSVSDLPSAEVEKNLLRAGYQLRDSGIGHWTLPNGKGVSPTNKRGIVNHYETAHDAGIVSPEQARAHTTEAVNTLVRKGWLRNNGTGSHETYGFDNPKHVAHMESSLKMSKDKGDKNGYIDDHKGKVTYQIPLDTFEEHGFNLKKTLPHAIKYPHTEEHKVLEVCEGKGWPDKMEAKPATRTFNYETIGHGRPGVVLWAMDRSGNIEANIATSAKDTHDNLDMRTDRAAFWGRYDPRSRECSIANPGSGPFKELKEKHIKALARRFNISTLYYFGDPMGVDPDLSAEFDGFDMAVNSYYDEAGYQVSNLHEGRIYVYTSPHAWRKIKSPATHVERAYLREDGYLVAQSARGWKLYKVNRRRVAETVAPMLRSGNWPKSLAFRWADDYVRYDLNEISPPGWSGTVSAMKRKHPEINNPYALSWAGYHRGYHSHYAPTKKSDRSQMTDRQLKKLRRDRG